MSRIQRLCRGNERKIEVKSISSKGVISKRDTLNPEFGGKFYHYEITLENGFKAYVLKSSEEYMEIDSIYPKLRKGITENFGRNVGNSDRVIVEYIPWKGMNVITAIDFEDPERR